MHQRILLLPERRLFKGQAFSAAFSKAARKFRLSSNTQSGESAQLQRFFQCIPDGWPMAAIFRQCEAGDAQGWQWLRADPIFLQLEMRGARVMAWDNLPLSLPEKQILLSALKPLFDDAGFELGLSRHHFFYIRALAASKLPAFIPAPEILGADLAGLLPDDKQWLRLFNECQIILHNHPFNVARQQQGQLPINGLWFWGQGVLPMAIHHRFEIIDSRAEELLALKSIAQMPATVEKDALVDLRAVRNWADVESAFQTKKNNVFDFADGVQWHWQADYRWHFWRRTPPRFD